VLKIIAVLCRFAEEKKCMAKRETLTTRMRMHPLTDAFLLIFEAASFS
jgi:hypothetical protein